MAPLSIPPDGLVLLPSHPETPPSSKAPTQILRLNIAQHASEAILKTLRNHEQVRLRLGKQISIEYGKTTQHVHATAESFPSELFLGNTGKKEQLYFSGRTSHHLEVKKAREATAQSDIALVALENTLKSIKDQRASNETSFITNKDELQHLTGVRKAIKGHRPSPLLGNQASAFRKDHLFNGITRSTPSSPYLGTAFSPKLAPTSAPLPVSSAPSKDKIRLDAIKIPLVHLLAVRPLSSKGVAQRLRATKEDCDKLLEKLAGDSRESLGKKELKDKAYRELDVWGFSYPSQGDRQAAIDRAIHAFDRMRVGRSDNLWQLLLPQERRGKGECLSKLNFNQPFAATRTPKLSSEHAMLGGKGESVNESETDTQRGRLAVKVDQSAARAKSHDPLKKKKISEKEAVSKKHMQKEAMKSTKTSFGKDLPRPDKKSSKQAGNFKSSEFIEDSDDEMEDTTIVPSVHGPSTDGRKGKLATMSNGKIGSSRPTSSATPKTSSHKSKLSVSSLPGSDITQNRERSSAVQKSLPRPSNQSTTARLSPRPRNDSSPQKPSPLASSPTNATDLDNSTSSKSSSLSSAASSPPSSSDIGNHKSSSTNITHSNPSPTGGKSPLKRKADTNDDIPAAKRHQVNGISHKPFASNSSAHGPSEQRPNPPRKASDSDGDSVSSPEKPDQARVTLNEKSRKFKTYYRNYKEMHAKIMSSPRQDDEELAQLHKMHGRIAGLKQEIWDDWKQLAR